MDAVPFKINDVSFFTEAEGVLRNEGTHLCLEHQTQDDILGVFKGEITQFRLLMDDIAAVTLAKGWFEKWRGAKIVIQCASMETLQAMPGASQGRIELHIAPRDLEAADHFVYQLHESQGVFAGALA